MIFMTSPLYRLVREHDLLANQPVDRNSTPIMLATFPLILISVGSDCDEGMMWERRSISRMWYELQAGKTRIRRQASTSETGDQAALTTEPVREEEVEGQGQQGQVEEEGAEG
jgi:hypothetical protein